MSNIAIRSGVTVVPNWSTSAERELLAAMRRAERVIDVENLHLARLHGRTELVKQSRTQSRHLDLAWRILYATDGRLRGQRRTTVRTAPDRNFHQRIVAQPIEVVGIFIATGDRSDTRHHQFEHRVSDPVRIAAIGHRVRKSPAHTERALRFSQQQQATIGRLVAAIKIDCELLAADSWQVEGKRRIVGHGGCGVRLMREALCLNNDLLRESLVSRYSRRKLSQP
jgi:hypothetical protein